MGLEPTTFEIKVQRADPLRNERTDRLSDSVANERLYWKNVTAS